MFDKYGLINLNRVWGFLSTIVEESGLKPVAENLNYSAERLVEMNRIAWPGKFPTLAVAQALLIGTNLDFGLASSPASESEDWGNVSAAVFASIDLGNVTS